MFLREVVNNENSKDYVEGHGAGITAGKKVI